jgi:hypothetical protein
VLPVVNENCQELAGESDLMRKLLFLICVVGISCTSWAQTDQTSWTNLSFLYAGQKIQVVDMHSKKHSGIFVNFSETAISYQDAAGQQTIPRHDVRRVKLMENKHRLRNTLIGAGVGAGVGAGIGAAAYQPCSSASFCLPSIGRSGTAGIGLVIGFLGGTVVGVLWPSHHTIYSVNSH